MKLFKRIDFDGLLVAVAILSSVGAYFLVTNSERGEEIAIQQCEIIFEQLERLNDVR
jgi:hypothetical protein